MDAIKAVEAQDGEEFYNVYNNNEYVRGATNSIMAIVISSVTIIIALIAWGIFN